MPKTSESRLKYIKEYNRNNTKVISFRLNLKTDEQYIEIYEQIPNKREWFLKCLQEYKKHLEK